MRHGGASHNPSIWEGEAGGSGIRDKSGSQETLLPETNCSTCNENANSEIHLVACQCCTACWIQILTHSNAVRRGCRHFHWADGEVTAQRG